MRSIKTNRLVQQYGAHFALCGGLLIILFATLTSFNFQFKPLTAADYFGGFYLFSGSYLDLPLNVILFMPFGFGLSAVLDKKGYSKRFVLVTTAAAGFVLTLIVESLQFYLPVRTPSVFDLLTNTLGALAGLVFYRLWQNRPVVVEKTRAIISNPQKLAIALTFYLLLLLGMAFLLQRGSRLMNWQPAFPLLIGNEHSQDRPWAGSVTKLAIIDKALSASETNVLFSNSEPAAIFGEQLVAFYPLTDAVSLHDQTGNLPDLMWKNNSDDLPVDKTPQLDGQHWLETESSIAYLTERLQTTSEFTLSLTVATADTNQEGPARIMSVSIDPFLRNMMIGQDGTDLVLRVRTPLTGENGAVPELIIPNVFVDKAPRHIIITFDGLAIQTYINDDRQVNNIELVPGLIVFVTLFGPFDGRLDALTGRLYSTLFYALAFIPLGILLALLAARIKRKSTRIWLVTAGICLPPLLLEIILSARNGFDIRLFNILLGAAITTIIVWLLAPTRKTTQHLFGAARVRSSQVIGRK